MGRIAGAFLAGLLALLPILVTVSVTVWVAQLVQGYAGPDSMVGRLLVLLGLNLVSSASSSSSAASSRWIVETRLRPLVQGASIG